MLSALPSVVNALATEHPRVSAVLRLAGRAARRAVAERNWSSLPGPDGVIDFRNRRSMYSRGAFWRLIADGQDYAGQPGEWEVGPADSLSVEDPFWLFALLAATAK